MTTTKAHWEQIYANKSPSQVSWYQSEPLVSLRLIRNCRLEKNVPIIDVGGGAAVLVDRLLEEGYEKLAVLDISSKALAYAKARLGGKAQRIEWFDTDIMQFQPQHQFSLWHDRAVFHFLSKSADRKKYLEVLKRSLKAGGYLIIAAFAIGGPEKCSGLDVIQYDAEKLLAELGDEFLLIEQETEMHKTPANKPQLFSYFRFLRH
jgi:ubiquinone/menaquinone biosynthesis C-methylase UbiE